LEGLEGSIRIPTSDVDNVFRQESNFYFVTGCNEASCAALLDLKSGQFIMLIPDLDDEYALWCGEYPVESDYKSVLGADRVAFNTYDNLNNLLKELNIQKLYTLNHTSKKLNEHLDKSITVDSTHLYGKLRDLRLVKTADEIEEMRKIGKISAEAHMDVMRNAKPGMLESELEALFTFGAKRRGAQGLAYPVIAAGDDRGATLHYVANNKVVHDGSLFLIDAGAELETVYGADITRTYPINGKFTKQQREIYEIVLKANKMVIENMKPGVEWVDMHRLANRIITEGLKNVGILVADSLQELIDNHVGGFFFPHGLGHSIGLDTHDPPNRDGSFQAINEPGIRYLRVHCTLKEGVALTVEPGIYFVPRMLTKALNDPNVSKYINREKLQEYMKFGGIRIEDNVVVTQTGAEVLTRDVVKEVDEIESIMAGSH
jgi:Xaa-Pro dipeptidase